MLIWWSLGQWHCNTLLRQWYYNQILFHKTLKRINIWLVEWWQWHKLDKVCSYSLLHCPTVPLSFSSIFFHAFSSRDSFKNTHSLCASLTTMEWQLALMRETQKYRSKLNLPKTCHAIKCTYETILKQQNFHFIASCYVVEYPFQFDFGKMFLTTSQNVFCVCIHFQFNYSHSAYFYPRHRLPQRNDSTSTENVQLLLQVRCIEWLLWNGRHHFFFLLN